MAKKDAALSYLQAPLPQGSKYAKMTKLSFVGLNKRHTVDTGVLSMESNISTAEAPYLVPSCKPESFLSGYSHPIGMFGFDDFLIIVYRDGAAIKIDYITKDKTKYTGVLKASGATADDETPRSIVQFNVYDMPTEPLNGGFIKKLLIFPDKMSMDFKISSDFTPDSLGDAIPSIKYATVHLSRVFGVDDDRVYASGFNDYANWNLDKPHEYNESNAWCSPSQSNTKANGNFTGITTFQNHVVCFKHDFMHEIYNTKNPFRIQDIYAEGAVDNRTVQDVDGRLIFVSEDDVKIYTGSNPRIIGYNLGMPRYEYAVSGTDGRNYYLYCEDGSGGRYLYVYDTLIDGWSERSVSGKVLSFAHNKNGMYMLCGNGVVYRIDSGSYNHKWKCETDLITNHTVDIKHIKKLQMLADIAEDANIKVYILYDDEAFGSTSHLVYSGTGSGSGKKPIRVKPRKTANYGFKLHFEGEGYVKLYELEIFTEAGGELFV